MIDHYAQLMTTFPAFEGYTVHGTKGMIESGRVRELGQGERLFNEGEPAKTALLVLTGKVELFVERNGRILQLTDAEPSRMLSELAALGGAVRASSARTAGSTTVVEWETDTFRRLVMGDAVLSERIFRDAMRTLIEEELALTAALAAVKEVISS